MVRSILTPLSKRHLQKQYDLKESDQSEIPEEIFSTRGCPTLMKGYSVGRFVPTRVILPGISVCRFSSSKSSNQKADNAEVRVFAQRILMQKIQVLNAISDDDYIRKLSSSSSVGAHIRHSLDHFNSVFDACYENAVLDYDSRNRDSDNERVREAALKNCNILLEKLHQDISDIPVMVRFLSDSSAGKFIQYA